MSFPSGIRSYLPLIEVIFLALLLRLWGIGFSSFHPDEKNIVQLGLDMLKRGSLEPEKMNYGSLPIYAQTLCFWILEGLLKPWRGDLPIGYGNAIGAGRMISVVSSVATVYLTHRLTQLLQKPAVVPEPPTTSSLVAASIMAVAFVAVQCAHYATVDSLAMALVTAGLVHTLRFYHLPSLKHAGLAGLFIGLATATKYTTVLASLSLALVPVLITSRPRPWKQTLFGLGLIPIAFFTAMPYALIRYDKLLKAVEFESHHYRTGGETIFAMGEHTWWWNLEFLYYSGLGPGLFLMSLLGLMLCIHPLRESAPALMRARLLPLVYALLAYAFISRYTVRFDRNLLPFLPVLATFAALWSDNIRNLSWRYARPLLRLTLLFSLLYPLSRGVVFGMELQKPHTKALLRQWKKAQPASVRIAEHGRKLDHPIQYYIKRQKQYLIMSSHSLEPIAAHPERFPTLYRNYSGIFAGAEVVRVFRNPWFDSDFFAPHHLLNSATVNVYHGPTIWVLKLPTLAEWNERQQQQSLQTESGPAVGNSEALMDLHTPGRSEEAEEEGENTEP